MTVFVLMLLDGDVQAQIASDNTTDTKVQANQNTSVITGGIQSGNNLFHSFEQFSLTTGAAVNFDHALEIENIFSRVTGGTVSQIGGLIQTQGNANLFLLNPAGIVFGANAQLDIGGSFIATTGDRLIFEDGVEFSTVTTKDKALLTITSPIGLQYGGNVGNIEVLPNVNRGSNNSGLDIKPGNTLALLGGDVSMNRNSLNAIGSNVEIGSVKSGVIGLQTGENGWQFNYQAAQDLGKIDLSDRALINNSGGRVNFRGNTISLATGSGIRDFNNFNQTRSSIKITAAESINLDGGLLLTQVGQQRNELAQAIANVGGDILLQAPQVFLSNGSVVSAGTLSNGAGGNITINARDLVQLSGKTGKTGSPSIVSTSTQGIGNGGQIGINTSELIIDGGSQIQALAGAGAGGTITVNAGQAVKISGTGSLRSRDRAGNLSEIELKSGFAASSGIEGLPALQQSQGKSGNLVINTPNLTIKEKGQISVSNYGLADAGDIKIITSTLSLDQAGAIVANTASGEGGSISIIADKLVILDHGSSISTTAEQNGNGGNINLKTQNLVLLESNQVNANARQGNGGNITIDTQGLFIDPSSKITASSEVEQKKGSVEIVTLDLNSRLEINDYEQSSFTAENQISTGCGVGMSLAQNQFRDLGRGGIPSNLLQELTNWETLGDLGQDQPQTSNSSQRNQKSPVRSAVSGDEAILEANNWIVNSQGVVELVTDKQIAAAMPASSCGVR
ncbi:MAG: filamentous hemagglutinin N-terminal domain-containing protein [Pleurocapsa sp.]